MFLVDIKTAVCRLQQNRAQKLPFQLRLSHIGIANPEFSLLRTRIIAGCDMDSTALSTFGLLTLPFSPYLQDFGDPVRLSFPSAPILLCRLLESLQSDEVVVIAVCEDLNQYDTSCSMLQTSCKS